MITKLLGELDISPNETHPLGGLNIYSKEFDTQGYILFNICNKLLNFEQKDKVLDFGCGTGRLLKHLKKENLNYQGFEINNNYGSIAKQFGEVRTRDINHPEYNKNGSLELKDNFTEYESEEFNKIISLAVLNHQSFKEASIIIKELLRITKKNGLILITVFLINNLTQQLMKKASCKFDFIKSSIDNFSTNLDRPYLNNAFYEDMIRKVIINNKGQIVEPIYYGEWRGQNSGLTGHDVIVIRKL